MTHQQHLQMGLRKGMAILIYYVVENTHCQAVLIAEESVMNRGRRGENRLWKRVTPSVTEFAWLPPNIAESFCKNELDRATNPVTLWLKLPSRLKSLCRTANGAKAPSSLVHTGTGPARSQVGWLSCLVFAFFFLSSAVWTHWSTFSL